MLIPQMNSHATFVAGIAIATVENLPKWKAELVLYDPAWIYVTAKDIVSDQNAAASLLISVDGFVIFVRFSLHGEEMGLLTGTAC